MNVNLKYRSSETNNWFKDCAENEIIDYDILLDFDSKGNFKKMLRDIRFITELLNDFVIMYYIIPSGRNYQIVLKNNNVFNREQIKEITINMKETFKLETLDLSGIGSLTKVMKTPYSIVNNENMITSQPLTMDELDNIENLDYKAFSADNYILKKTFNPLWLHPLIPSMQKENLIRFIKKIEAI
jgi:hypothetical protein